MMLLTFFLFAFGTVYSSRLQITQASDDISSLVLQEAETDLFGHLSENLDDCPEIRQLEEDQALNQEVRRLDELSQKLQQNCDNMNRYLNFGKPRPSFENAQPLEIEKLRWPAAQTAGKVHPVMFYGPLQSFRTYPYCVMETGLVTITSIDNILNASVSSGGGVQIMIEDHGFLIYESSRHSDLVLVQLRPVSSLIPSFGLFFLGMSMKVPLSKEGLFALLPRTILEQINETVFKIPAATFQDVLTTFTDYIEALGVPFYLTFYVQGISQN